MLADTLSPDAAAQTTTGGPGMALLLHSAVAVGVTAVGSLSLGPLLADASAGETVGIGAVLVALGAAGKWAADWIVNLRKARNEDEDKREARQFAREQAATDARDRETNAQVLHLEKALDRETEERRRLQSEMAQIRDQMIRAEIKANKAETWIRALEGLLRIKGIEHLPYNGDDWEDFGHYPARDPHPGAGGPGGPNGPSPTAAPNLPPTGV